PRTANIHRGSDRVVRRTMDNGRRAGVVECGSSTIPTDPGCWFRLSRQRAPVPAEGYPTVTLVGSVDGAVRTRVEGVSRDHDAARTSRRLGEAGPAGGRGRPRVRVAKAELRQGTVPRAVPARPDRSLARAGAAPRRRRVH